MNKQKLVVALGRNAFGETFPKQKDRVRIAAKSIGDLIEDNFDLVITHSNGPQVGTIQTAMTEYSRLDSKYTVAPMSVCSAMSQGYIGYDLQNAIRTEILQRGIYKPVVTLITQVRVDPFDQAFHNPTKVIGRYMTKEEADLDIKKGNYVTYEETETKKGYRRIIASPLPIDIYEIDSIKTLSDSGQVVIAAGGGGIPVLEQNAILKGASAIIEKDFTAAKMADMLDADKLLILSSSEYMTITKEDETITELKNLSLEEAIELTNEDYFDIKTTLPKIQAAINFVSAKKGRVAIITSLEKAKLGANLKTGTIIS